jgi:hypothetical protein
MILRKKVLGIFLLLSINAIWAKPICESYGVDDVILKGRLVGRIFFGPPNYGENSATDTKESQIVLKLDSALCTNASNQDQAERNQHQVTLVPIERLALDSFIGKHVAVKGRLFHAYNGHHRTAVLIAIKTAPTVE